MLLMNGGISGQVHVAKIGFDLRQYFFFRVSQRVSDLRMNAENGLADVIHGLGQAPRLFHYLVTDALRRFDQRRTLAIRANRTECSLERLLDPFAGHDDQTEIVV